MKQVLLVIDDDENMVALISAICRKHLPEVHVVTALNGTRGLQLAQSEKPGVVVLDVKLPDINGFDVCRRLRSDPATINTHILMISGVMMEAQDRVQGIESGADGYLFKPFEPQELVLHIQALFRWWEAEQMQVEKLEELVTQRTEALVAAEADRCALAERMQQLQKEQSLSRLAGGVAHDFNNLLQAVIGNAELALEALPVGASGRSYLEELMKTTQRMAELTRQMLVYSGGKPFARRAVDLNQLLQGINLRVDAGLPAAISLMYALAAELPSMEGDETLLKLAVLNLVQNAGEAMGTQPGVITIRTDAATLNAAALARANVGRELPPGSYLTLEVSDTGCGMDEDVQKHIFDPFFSTKLVGRGLGLPMVAGVMRAHNGAIFFTSVPRQGTTFRLAWPVFRAAHPAAQPVAPLSRPRASGSANILVVEDDPDVLKIACQCLLHAGYQVLTAANGEEGIAVFRRDPAAVALVLMDLEMPKMGGVQAFREIRRIRPEVPVIITSGYVAEDLFQQFGADQPAGFLGKPYSRATLFEKLKMFLD